MARRKVAETSPPTLTSQEVAEVFLRSISPSNLQYLDEKGYLRPTYYFSRASPGSVMAPQERDLLVGQRGRSRGDHHRRYTYADLVWIRLLIYVKEGLETAKATCPLKKAGDIVRRLRGTHVDGCPPPSRLVFLGQHVYLLEDAAAVSLTDGQLAITQILTDNVEAEVKGRIDALVALQRIRPIPTKCLIAQGERRSA